MEFKSKKAEKDHKLVMLAFARKKAKKELAQKLVESPTNSPPQLTEDEEILLMQQQQTKLTLLPDLSKMPKFELDKEYVRKRIKAIEVRTMAHELDLARIREDLIEKKLVEKQAAFLLMSMRAKLLNIPNAYARKLLHVNDIKVAHSILQAAIYAVLDEIKNMPQQIIDPNWLESLEEEEA